MAKKEETEKKIAAMRKIGIPEDEIKQILEDDLAIDRGADLFKLDKEKEKIAKAARATGTREAKKPVQKEKKKDEEKALIIAVLARFLAENSEISAENLQISNPERMITFNLNENLYELTLIKKRKG